MAKPNTRPKPPPAPMQPAYESPRHRPKWFSASITFVIGILVTVAFIDFRPEQGSNTTHPTDVNLVGQFGTVTSEWSFKLIGGAAWLMPFFMFWLTYLLLRKVRRFTGSKVLTMLICLLAAAALCAMQTAVFTDRQIYNFGPGGWTGNAIYDWFLKDKLGTFGSGLVLGAVYLLGVMFLLTRDIGAECDKLLASFQEWRRKRAELRAARAEERRKQKAALDAITKPAPAAPLPPPGAVPPDRSAKPVLARGAAKQPAAPDPAAEEERQKAERTAAAKAAVAAALKKDKPEDKKAKDKEKDEAADGPGVKLPLKIVTAEEPKKADQPQQPRSDDNYQFPPLSLLRQPVRPAAGSEEEHQHNAANLLRILAEFGVEVTLGEIHVGPVITCYEVIPAAGVRVEKIAGLDKNIALGLKAQSVRILAPIPGKAAVGVEVPNQHATPVGVREIFESVDWVNQKADLPMAIGKEISGRPLISDLTRMPHLLIAGATGSGKSVCINSIIASIVYRAKPQDVRLIMVDPKIVELQIFNSLPHMLIPVVTEPKKVPSALKWLLNEMERRYQMFARVGVRNISGFNNRKKTPPLAKPAPAEKQGELIEGPVPEDEPLPDRIPFIVVIMDELADLMMIAPAEIETCIARLAQLARAAGIHLIIATQRPSVNVITGVIKANLPSRIAFQVASNVDSRTILDGKGAEALIGRGDMLFSPPGTAKLVRAQGAFISDEEIAAIVEYLKRNGPPRYAEEVQAHIDRDPDEEDDEGGIGDDGELGDDAELLQKAIAVLRSTRRASTSMLQRRLKIGYNRAARIMELMEEKGIVGPDNGSSPRDILVDLDKL